MKRFAFITSGTIIGVTLVALLIGQTPKPGFMAGQIGAPGGVAGGALAGTFPNPSLAVPVAQDITLGASNCYGFSGLSWLCSSGDGLATLYNNAKTGFTRLNFGGNTNTFFGIKAASNRVEIVNGDGTLNSDLLAATLISNGSTIGWLSSSKFFSVADGVIRLWNNAQTGFTRLNFGGDTSSFPALGVNGASLQARLADNSADTTFEASKLLTGGNCSSSAAPAVCGSSASGSVVVAAAGTTVTVNTTAVTANSQILLTWDSSLGAKLSVTCNTTEPALYGVTARVAATSFTITSSSPSVNPACFSYLIVN